MSEVLRAPFSYFGGKRHAAARIWSAIGNVAHYVEPFCGSAAVLLARPSTPHRETINDADGMVSNFWRAAKFKPAEVAGHASWPCNEVDLHARHAWLIGQRESLTENLIADPEWCDPRIAGWWAWGSRAWIGTGGGAETSLGGNYRTSILPAGTLWRRPMASWSLCEKDSERSMLHAETGRVSCRSLRSRRIRSHLQAST